MESRIEDARSRACVWRDDGLSCGFELGCVSVGVKGLERSGERAMQQMTIRRRDGSNVPGFGLVACDCSIGKCITHKRNSVDIQKSRDELSLPDPPAAKTR